jgi:alpha-galactosidase
VLSISPGPAPISEVQFLQKYSQMWRISDDFWDDWKLLKKQFDYTRDWAIHVGMNHTWPDADMLPLGELRVTAKEGGGSPTKFTPDEQQTLMTLWCMFRSPLIFGGDLPSNDAATNALLTNDEVLAVDQHSYGSHQSFEEGNLRAWTAVAEGGKDSYIAVFNLGDETTTATLPWNKFFKIGSSAKVRDLWAKKTLGRKAGIDVTLHPHASVLYRVSELR